MELSQETKATLREYAHDVLLMPFLRGMAIGFALEVRDMYRSRK
eukprot:CAMPEP_0198317158 /NCGR_PEP_ID=MMETSP1450-20131203/6743_1 /TAXON_ID=753684 ORGANISM="Madagascaria erythrocladiodes, Strain CCMP3234" /NCGR_SAMPLE_ID=MMETSP1450 /ASSEMBLY_ACC=CAM_ASM_001115 /LENGTH=43 /DNA_ID= /DNA_START= /DNA_END= /DNA_ORIENTATION=